MSLFTINSVKQHDFVTAISFYHLVSKTANYTVNKISLTRVGKKSGKHAIPKTILNMGCGTAQSKASDTTVEDKIDSYAYEVVFTKQFHPELYASEFIGKCQKSMQSLFTFQYQMCDQISEEPKLGFCRSVSQISIDRSMISEMMDMRSMNDLGQVPEESRIDFDEAASEFMRHGGFSHIDESETQQWSATENQTRRPSESNLKSHDVFPMGNDGPEKLTICTNKITFFHMYMLIRKHYSYFNEFDLYQYYWYVTQPITGTVQKLGEQFQLFRDKNEYTNEETIDIQLYLKLMYMISPDQGKNILHQPLHILFYACDDMFNDRAITSNFISFLKTKFPGKNLSALEAFIRKNGNIIDRATFEMQIADKMKTILEKEEIKLPSLAFSYKRENLSQYLQKWQASYRKKRKYLDELIGKFEQRAQDLGMLRNNSRGFKTREQDVDI